MKNMMKFGALFALICAPSLAAAEIPNGQASCLSGTLYAGFSLRDLGIDGLPKGAVVDHRVITGSATSWRDGGKLNQALPADHVFWGKWSTKHQAKYGNLNVQIAIQWPNGKTIALRSRPRGNKPNKDRRAFIRQVAATCPAGVFRKDGILPLPMITK